MRFEAQTERNEEEILQAEQLADSLRKMNYFFNNIYSPHLLLSNPETFIALLDNAPYLVEKVPKKDIYDNLQRYSDDIYQRIVKILEKGNYIFSPRTPYFLINQSIKYELESYEMFFEEYKGVTIFLEGLEEQTLLLGLIIKFRNGTFKNNLLDSLGIEEASPGR